MNIRLTPLQSDLLFHLICFAAVSLSLLPGGFLQANATIPLVYPFFFILAAITLFRQSEAVPQYGTRLVMVPSVLCVLLYGFSLINESTRDYWAFTYPRLSPVIFRWIWVQAGLLLIHPEIYPRALNALSSAVEFLHRRGYFGRKVWATCFVMLCVMWGLRNLSISPDGYDWIRHSIIPGDWADYLREPLGAYLIRLAVIIGHTLFDWEPYPSVFLLLAFCGFAATALLVPVYRFLFGEEDWKFCLAFLLSCAGYTQLFFGNVEIYALLQAGLAMYLFSVMRYLRGEWPVWASSIVFGLMLCLHLSTGWWLPAFLLVPWLARRMGWPAANMTREYARALAPFAAVVLSFWLLVLFYRYGGSTARMWEHFVGDEVMNVGVDRAMFNPLSTYTQWDYYVTMFNEYFFLLSGFYILIALLVAAWKYASPMTLLQGWFLVMAGFYFLYSIVWHPDRKFPADWDLFSGLTIPLSILLCLRVTALRIPKRAIHYILYQTSLFSALYLIWFLVRNHIRGLDWSLFQE